MPDESPENGGPKPPEPVEETSAAEEWGRLAVQAGYLLGGGFQMAAATVIGVVLGKWIDGKAGTGFFAPVLALLGFALGVYSLYRMIVRMQRRQDSGT